ncbi:MAG: hypothetical protein JHC87_05410, partial [Thermoleophilaceae bacterium]|nr:hypothetical protein [Thermoleophilaceae bacterium]
MEASLTMPRGTEVNEAQPQLETPEWTDPKRYLWLLGLVIPAAPLLLLALWLATDVDAVWWIGPFLFFFVLPFGDAMVGSDAENPPDLALAWLEEDRYYRWCTYLYLPLQFASIIMACWVWGSGEMGFLGDLGLAGTVGIVSGVAINTAHELGHKRASHERWLSKVALSTTCYGHFYIEHNRGHHVRV